MFSSISKYRLKLKKYGVIFKICDLIGEEAEIDKDRKMGKKQTAISSRRLLHYERSSIGTVVMVLNFATTEKELGRLEKCLCSYSLSRLQRRSKL